MRSIAASPLPLLLGLPLALAALLECSRRWRQAWAEAESRWLPLLLALALVVSQAAALYLTDSRNAWGALVVALPVVVGPATWPWLLPLLLVAVALISLASLGGVPAIGGDAAAKASESEAAHMKDVQSGAWVPADSMAFDKVIHPGELRNELIEVLHRT